MILENRCHGIRPWKRFTVRVQSEMLSSNSRSGASFFYSTCLTIGCLLVGHDTGVIDTGKKLLIFSDQAGHDETASPKSYAVGHAEDYKRKPWHIKTSFLHKTNKGSEELCQFCIPISKKVIESCFRNGKEHQNSIASDEAMLSA